MQRQRYASASRRNALYWSLIIAVLAGCQQGPIEEAEHHAPAHRPADFPAAVTRFQELHEEILAGHSREAGQLDAFAEAYDIARWLPDLAADSDLEEAAWNRVHLTSQGLESILADVLSNAESNRRRTYLQYETELGKHQLQLVEIKQSFPESTRSLAHHEST